MKQSIALTEERILDFYRKYVNHMGDSSDFINEQLRENGQGVLEKEFSDSEYEIKFKFENENVPIKNYLEKIEGYLENSSTYLVDKVQHVHLIKSYFFNDTTTEYSLFNWNDGPMLKIKEHEILSNYSLPVFKNNEYFIVDPEEINNILKKDQIKYAGSMTKNRVKDFILDTSDGRVYAIAITICESMGNYQYQFEVEYSGYIRGHANLQKGNENQIIEKLLALSNFLFKRGDGFLQPDVERKYDFVTKCESINREEINIIKNNISMGTITNILGEV